MQRILITAPTEDIVTLDEVKAHLRYEDTDQDLLIQALIDATVAILDPSSGGSLGRALRPQTWELQLDGFPWRRHHHHDAHHTHEWQITLPFPPLTQIVSVKYDDEAGTEHTLTEGTDFEVIGLGGLGKQAIRPPYLGYWPLARRYPGSVRIRFDAGYPKPTGDDDDTLPAAIKAAIKLYVGHLFGNREAVVAPLGNDPKEIPLGFNALLDPYRVF